ncbi:hypothetical protein ACJVC5_04285 [Peredibacter sp. HCB2-198]|uniref:hypothetical protein n=1 Tax=Peredibacter sp. HCB2-198 TaxID=3383025 RepID=UPI0038B56BB6
MKTIIALCLLITTSLAHAGYGLNDFGVPALNCYDKQNIKVSVYIYSEGLLGIRVLSKDYLLDQRMNQLDLPLVELAEIPTRDADNGQNMRFFNKDFSVVLKLFTKRPFNTVLVTKNKKYSLSCSYGYQP